MYVGILNILKSYFAHSSASSSVLSLAVKYLSESDTVDIRLLYSTLFPLEMVYKALFKTSINKFHKINLKTELLFILSCLS